jgi:PAS domain S-box-containing protein
MFEQVFEWAPDALVVTDRRGRIVRVNRQTEELFDYRRDDLLGQPVEMLLPERFVSLHAEHRTSYMSEPRSRPMGARLPLYGRRRDGSEFCVDIMLSPLETEDGIFVLAVVRDITDRKQAEEALRRAHDELELRVQERTAELAQANEALHAEIAERQRAQEELSRRNRELLTLHRMSEISLSVHSLDEAFQEIVEEISSATGFPVVAIELYDEARQKMVFKGVKGIPVPPNGGEFEVSVEETLSGIVVRSGRPLVETHAWDRPEYINERLRRLGVHTFVCVPMTVGHRVIGALSLAHPDAIPLDDHLPQWAATLANHVASLIERKQVEERLARVASIPELNPNPIVEVDLEGRVHYLNPVALRSFGDPQTAGFEHPLLADLPSLIATLQGGGKIPLSREVRIGDVWYHQALHFLPQSQLIRIYMLDINKRKQAEERLTTSREQLRNLAARLQDVREEERTLIAREVHDELGQAMTGLKMDLSWLSSRVSEACEEVARARLMEKIGSMSKLIDATIQSVRKISTELRPGVLDDLGLVAAIEWQAQEFQARTGIACELTLPPDDASLDRERSTAIFRIFQEILTNVTRHAKATRVRVSMTEEAGQIILQVRDNGQGITEGQIADPRSLGLLGMRERALILGGEVTFSGTQGQGTTVTVRIPLG